MPTFAPPEPNPRAHALLLSSRSAFVRKGFDSTSMRDLAREAGISAGNFYRYFPSKLALLEALIAVDMAEIDLDFTAIIADARPAEALRAKLAARLASADATQGALWAEISAAGLRESQIAASCQRFEALIENRLIEIFALIAGQPNLAGPDQLRPHAHYIVLIMKAAASRRPDEVNPAVNSLILRGIDRVLEDVAALAVEPAPCA